MCSSFMFYTSMLVPSPFKARRAFYQKVDRSYLGGFLPSLERGFTVDSKSLAWRSDNPRRAI